MSVCRFIVASLALGACLAVVSASPATAHGGSSENDASNYRSQVVAVEPPAPGVRVGVIDNGSRLELAYTGTGEVVVLGYRGEPYLRITPRGVEENLRSPATYLNTTLTATAPVPEYADPQAEPEWRHVSTSPVARWHDHRAHWMSADPPPAVQRDPGVRYVIFDPWVVSILADGTRVEVRGALAWEPPPDTGRWWTATALVFAGILGVLLRTSQLWVRIAGLGLGLVADLVGTTGRCLASSESLFRRGSLYLYALLILLGIARGWLHAVRGHRLPVLAIGLAGLVLATQSGAARISTFSYSQLPSTVPGTVERAATVVCMAVGWALLADFVWSLYRVTGAGGRGTRAVNAHEEDEG